MIEDDSPVGLSCPACAETYSPQQVRARCPDCGGPLRVTLDVATLPADPERFGESDQSGLARFGRVLGLDEPPELGAGGIAPVECPSLAVDVDVDRLWIADEGRNPTGSAVDREMAFAVAAAVDHGTDRVVLPSTGHGAQSAAAYAGRAGIDSLAVVPSRTPFLNKAMANVHGGDLSVVEGRYADADDAYDPNAGFPVDPHSPFRRLGAVTLAWDLLAGLDWTVPDAIVLPVGHGHRIAGLETGLRAAAETGLVERTPRLYAAQPAGCAPIVTADGGTVKPTTTPDSIVGPLEVPDPALGSFALDAIATSAGGAVAVPDNDALGTAVDANATTGIECSATGGIALAGASVLREQGDLDEDDAVLLVDPLAAAAESDVLRSHLMSRGD